MKIKSYIKVTVIAVACGLVACNDYLDKEPLSQITPEKYFNDEASLELYCNGRYTEILPSHGNWSYGIYGDDNNTDNMASINYDGKYVIGKWKTSLTDGNYYFGNINTINYFFDQTLEKFENNQISGNANRIAHFMGEMYFFRAYEYFRMLQRFGDFPIITTALPDNLATLTEASKRSPRNEVARFILSDLDKAIELLARSKEATTRINTNVAYLLKSRVALFEGSWLKNFAGTAFVPCSDEWPGKTKDYSSNYQFPTGSLENEYKWFFAQAMEAAQVVADEAVNNLTPNTGIIPETPGQSLSTYESMNPWLAMFGTNDLSSYSEVLLWRQYSISLGITHNVVVQAQRGNQGVGTTRGMVEAFPMANGLPIYAPGSGYHGDQTIHDVRLDRDPRLFVMLKEPGQQNVLIEGNGSHATPVETVPKILDNNTENGYSTGYALRKGNCVNQAECNNGQNSTACPVFRSVEALLNYIEACYELNGSIDATAADYWRAIRARHAGLEQDFTITIQNTDMAEEAKGDWGAYTAGQLIDPVRYNIRRERRLELMAEGFRSMDLYRWRSLDQMTTTGYHIEGIHIWNTPMQDWYDLNTLRNTIATFDATGSEYLRPHEAAASSEVKDGLRWSMAHYLRPIPIKQMMLTAPDSKTVSDSPIYQNPFWPSEPNMPAQK